MKYVLVIHSLVICITRPTDDYVSPDILIEVENSDITITPINQPALMVNDTLYEKVKNDENNESLF